MNKSNLAKTRLLAKLAISTNELLKSEKEITDHTVFSFRYFDNSQEFGPDFSGLEEGVLKKVIEKIRHFSRESLQKWQREKVGKGKGHILEIYGEFPSNSLFSKPTFVPENVRWARYRMEWDFRLAGFILEESQCDALKINKNTFFIVFLDPYHKFYPGK